MNCNECNDLAAIKNDADKKLCTKHNWIFNSKLAANQKLCGTQETDWTEQTKEAHLA